MAKTSTSSARRGRHLVRKDYTSKIRADAYVREADRRAKMATAGMIGDFASGVADYAQTLKTNMKGWEQLEAGAEQLHKEGGEGTFSFDKALGKEGDPVSNWEKWTTQAPLTDQLSIGKDKFYGVQVSQVGKLGESAGMLVDDDSDKSLYDFLKIGGDKTTTDPDVMSSLGTMKKARPESSKRTIVIPSGKNKGTKVEIGSSQYQEWTGGQEHKDWLESRSSKPKPIVLKDPQNIKDLTNHMASQNVTTNQTTTPTLISTTSESLIPQAESLSIDNSLYSNIDSSESWFDSQMGGSNSRAESLNMYEDNYSGDFGVVPLGSVDVSRGMGRYRLKR